MAVQVRANKKRRLTPGQLLIIAVLIVVFVIAAYPFFYALSLAVMPYENYIRERIHLGPSGFTTAYFEQILSDQRLIKAFELSILRTVVGTSLNVIVTLMGAYALSRPQLKFRRFLIILFLIPIFFNGGIIPRFLVIRDVGLLNTFWALILPNLVSPFFFFVVVAYYREYPLEIIEAATIDGASQFGIFWRIVWPTSIPMIATMGVLYGTFHWNEYFWSGITVQPDLYTAPVVLNSMLSNRILLASLGAGTQLTPQSFISAVASTLIIPVLVIYPLLQRFVVRGILVGSVKG